MFNVVGHLHVVTYKYRVLFYLNLKFEISNMSGYGGEFYVYPFQMIHCVRCDKCVAYYHGCFMKYLGRNDGICDGICDSICKNCQVKKENKIANDKLSLLKQNKIVNDKLSSLLKQNKYT